MGYWSFNYKLRHVLQILNRNRTSTGFKTNSQETAVDRYQGLQLFCTSSRKTWTTIGNNIVKDGKEKIQLQLPVAATSGRRYFPYWVRWVLGSVLTALPFANEKWVKLRTIEGKTEMVAEEVENVAEVVEKVAIAAEKLSSEVADKLPENGKLKETALFIERLFKMAAQDAQLTKHFIQKVDELKHDLENLETFVEPVIDAKHQTKGK